MEHKYDDDDDMFIKIVIASSRQRNEEIYEVRFSWWALAFYALMRSNFVNNREILAPSPMS